MNLTATVARKVALPVLEEQCSVAAFLDRETVRIDGLVARKERLIELLREKRSALITRAVTRGLDPSVPLKDSGVEWLGEIPAHWEVRRMKLLLEEPLQYGANEPAEMMDENLPRYIRITDISEDGRLREETFRSIPEDVAEPYLLEEGDLLFARSGATVGKTFRYEGSWGRAAYAGYLIRARLDPRKGDGGFLQYFTTSSSYWDWLRSNFIQATIQNVSAERYANLAIPVPGLTEQHAIVSCLDREKAKIDALVAKVREAIGRLKEFRTALISAAVTGKIDVREEAR
jgi:restriction endonuclease S subunit